WMLGVIRIESRAAFHSGAVVLDDLFECLEAAVVHVRTGHFNIAQGGHGKFALIAFLSRHQKSAEVFGFGLQPVVGESLALEQWTAVAMKAIRPKFLAARVVLRVKQFEAPLLFSCELIFAAQHLVKL